MSIFTRSLMRELYRTSVGIFIVLLAITTSVLAIRYLGQASNGRINPRDVLIIMGFATLNVLAILLMLASFIGVLMVMIRNANEREFIVWNAAGISLLQWIKPVAGLVIPCALISALLSFYLAPWANQQTDSYRESFQKRDDLARLSSGRFQESGDGNRVFFVEEVPDRPNEVQNIFVFSKDPTTLRQTVILAHQGAVVTQADGSRLVTLLAGNQHEGQIGQSDYQVMSFAQYKVSIDTPPKQLKKDHIPDYSRDSMTLIREFRQNIIYQGELLSRLSAPIMALLLPFLAIGLGVSQPRGGRTMSLVFAILIYLMYNNLSIYFSSAVKQGVLTFASASWPLHLIVGFLTLLFLSAKNHPSWFGRSQSYNKKRLAARADTVKTKGGVQ